MRRRDFIAGLGGTAAWPAAARAAQAPQPALPVIAFVNGGSVEGSAERLLPFRNGLGETGYFEGRNVAVEYYWLDGQFDRVPTLMANLVRRRVAVIVSLSNTLALASKAATVADSLDRAPSSRSRDWCRIRGR